ncbi:g9063 [Coccomyxa elongata]
MWLTQSDRVHVAAKRRTYAQCACGRGGMPGRYRSKCLLSVRPQPWHILLLFTCIILRSTDAGRELTDFPAAQASSVATPPGGVYAFKSPAAAGSPDAEESVRNLAHVAVSLQTSGTLLYTPASASTLDGVDFSTFLANAQKNSAVSGVRLKPGNYQMTNPQGDSYIYLGCVPTRTTPFEIDLSGSTLVSTTALAGLIILERCTAVTLHGPATLTYRMDQYPYAQGTILSVTNSYLTYTIQIHADFLATWKRMLTTFPNSESGGGVVYDPVTRLTIPIERGGQNFVVDFSSVVQNSANIYTMNLVRYTGQINAGELVVITQPSDYVGIVVSDSTGCTVRNFTVLTTPGFGFYDGTSTGQNSYLSLNLAPPSTPGSDGQTPLMSSIHDGIHSTSAVTGPIIDRCQFVSTGDDAIAIHGRFYTVVVPLQDEAALILGAPILNDGLINTGDIVTVYDPNARNLGSTTVVSVMNVKAPVPATTQDIVFGGDFNGYAYLKVYLTAWQPGFVGMPVNSFVSTPTRNGNGYSVTNNLMYNGRGRGGILRGSQGVMQGNQIIHMTGVSIHMAAGVDGTREAGFVENVLVRDNIMQGEQEGLLLAATTSAPPFIYADNNNFRFINNTIDGSQFSPLSMSSAATVLVQDTKFINIMCSATVDNTRSYAWEVQYAAMQFLNVYGASFSGNTLTFNSGCARLQTNLQSPIYAVNTTHIAGAIIPPITTTAGTTAVSSFQAAFNSSHAITSEAQSTGQLMQVPLQTQS